MRRSPPRSAVVTYGGGAKPLAARGMPFGERRAAAALSFARPAHALSASSLWRDGVHCYLTTRASKSQAQSAFRRFHTAKNLHNLSYKRKDLFMEM